MTGFSVSVSEADEQETAVEAMHEADKMMMCLVFIAFAF